MQVHNLKTFKNLFHFSFLVYLKLFIGVGTIWTFDIIDGLIDPNNEHWIS